MYESSVMLKQRKTHIVSTLFDTINKMSHEAESEAATSEAATSEEATSEAATSEEATSEASIKVSVPNERLELKKRKPILICTYQVRTDGLYPFIMFLFKTSTDKASFIPYDKTKQKKNDIIAYMQTILPVTYAGFYETEENNIIILSAEETNTIRQDYIGSQDYIWATSFEIMNKKKIMHYHIDPVVIVFFLANPAFLILKEGNSIYESPMIGYKTHENTCSEDEMDIYREIIIPSLGKCYYLDIDIPKTSESIMRIAFFAGKMVLKKEKSYDSLLCGDKYYIIENYDQHVLLSVFH
jgi:hypothetical protein